MIRIKFTALQLRPTFVQLWTYYRSAVKPPTPDIGRVISFFSTIM